MNVMRSLKSFHTFFRCSAASCELFSTTSVAASSNLTRFMEGNYHPLEKNKNQDTRQDEDRRRTQNRRQRYDKDRRPGFAAQRQAVEYTRERIQKQNRGGEHTQSSLSRETGNRESGRGQNSQDQGGNRRRQRFQQGSGPRPSAAAHFDPDDISGVDNEIEEALSGNNKGLKRRSKVNFKQSSFSTAMLGTISDDRAVLSSRGPRARRSNLSNATATSGDSTAALTQDGSTRRGSRKRRVGKEDDDGDANRSDSEASSFPTDAGLEAEADWHVLAGHSDGKDSNLFSVQTESPHSSYIMDEDGVTCEDIWESMTLVELREELIKEMSYSRADHEAWLRGPGRVVLEQGRRQYGDNGFESEQDFEEEIEMQMMLFDRYTWIDDLYYHAKMRQLEEARDGSAFMHASGEEHSHSATESEVGGAEAHADSADDDAVEASEETSDGSSNEEARSSDQVADDASQLSESASVSEQSLSAESRAEAPADPASSEESSESSSESSSDEAESVGTTHAQEHEEDGAEAALEALQQSFAGVPPEDVYEAGAEWMADQTERQLREMRMLRKFQAIREVAPIGVAPRRKGSEFNKRELELKKVDKMMEILDPDRARGMDGSILSERVSADVRRAMQFESHPEMMPGPDRPQLFPSPTMVQMSREYFDMRMDVIRDSVCHPMAGIHTDEDWQELKDRAFGELPEMMRKRFETHQEVGFSGLLGGFMEERAYLENIVNDTMPEDHPNRPVLDMYTAKIAQNAQWPWFEKCRAVAKTAKFLKLGAEFAKERERAEKNGEPSLL